MRKLQLARPVTQLSKEGVLREVPWVAELSGEMFAMLVSEGREAVFAKGSYLVRQGEVDDAVYLLVRGIVQIVQEHTDGTEGVVALRGTGFLLGEQSLLTGSPRIASARASTSVLALRLPHAVMRAAMDRLPELASCMWHHTSLNLLSKLLSEAEAARGSEPRSTQEELQRLSTAWVPTRDCIQLLQSCAVIRQERAVLLLQGALIEFYSDERKPFASEHAELLAMLASCDAEEASEAAAERTRWRKRKDAEPNATAAQAVGLLPGVLTGAHRPEEPHRASIGRERRSLLLGSRWIVHMAPCLLAAPPGGLEAGVQLMCLNGCRIAEHPAVNSMGSQGGNAAAHWRNAIKALRASANSRAEPTGLLHLDGANALPLLNWPRQIRPAVVKYVMGELLHRSYMPGEQIPDVSSEILDGSSGSKPLVVVLNGRIRCDHGAITSRVDADLERVGAGAPFDQILDLGPQLLSLPPGGVLGEWHHLQSEMRSPLRLTADTRMSTLILPEDALSAALMWDSNIESNLWWWHAARGAFFLLRGRQPFAGWQPSKLWGWLSTGSHLRLARDLGRGAWWPSSQFTILIHGSCHAGSSHFSSPDILSANSASFVFDQDSILFMPSADHAAWLPHDWSFTVASKSFDGAASTPCSEPYLVVVEDPLDGQPTQSVGQPGILAEQLELSLSPGAALRKSLSKACLSSPQRLAKLLTPSPSTRFHKIDIEFA